MHNTVYFGHNIYKYIIKTDFSPCGTMWYQLTKLIIFATLVLTKRVNITMNTWVPKAGLTAVLRELNVFTLSAKCEPLSWANTVTDGGNIQDFVA